MCARPTPNACARRSARSPTGCSGSLTAIDDRPVISERETKSSGSENTFERDLTNLDEIRQEVADMARSSASWLARRELFARTVVIKVRYNDFTTITRSHTETPTRDESSIVTRAIALLDEPRQAGGPCACSGVSVHNLCDVLTCSDGADAHRASVTTAVRRLELRLSLTSWFNAMTRDHADEKIEADLVAHLQPGRERFGPDSRDARLAIRFVGERVVHVVRQLTVNADWLHPVQHALSGSLQHKSSY